MPRGSIHTTIMELGTERPSLLRFWGPNSIMVAYMDPLGPLGYIYIYTAPPTSFDSPLVYILRFRYTLHPLHPSIPVYAAPSTSFDSETPFPKSEIPKPSSRIVRAVPHFSCAGDFVNRGFIRVYLNLPKPTKK